MNDTSIRSLASSTLATHLERQHHSPLIDIESLTGTPPDEIAAAIVSLGGSGRFGEVEGVDPHDAFKIGFDLALALGARLGAAPFASHEDVGQLVTWAKGQYGEARDEQRDRAESRSAA